MACLFQTTVERIAPGQSFLVEEVGLCVKLQPQPGPRDRASVFSKEQTAKQFI